MIYINRNTGSKTRTLRNYSVAYKEWSRLKGYSRTQLLNVWVVKYNLSYTNTIYQYSSFIRKLERSSNYVH
jgi:hypothetical protein